MLECKVLEASSLLSSSDRNWPIFSNGGRRLPWPKLQNSLKKKKILQIIALFGGSIQSNLSSERMCPGQVTAQYPGKYPEFSGSSEQSGSSGSVLQPGWGSVCFNWLFPFSSGKVWLTLLWLSNWHYFKICFSTCAFWHSYNSIALILSWFFPSTKEIDFYSQYEVA